MNNIYLKLAALLVALLVLTSCGGGGGGGNNPDSTPPAETMITPPGSGDVSDNEGPPAGHVDEPDTMAGAKTIASGETVTGYFDGPGDVDYLRLPLSPGLNEIDLDLDVPNGTEITVLDGNGNVVFMEVVQQGSVGSVSSFGKQALSIQGQPLEVKATRKVVTYCGDETCEAIVKLAKKVGTGAGKGAKWLLKWTSGGKTVQAIIKIINRTPLKLEFGLTVEAVNFDLKSFAECSFNAAVSPATISECTKDIQFELKHVIGSSVQVAGKTLTGWRVESGIFKGSSPGCGAEPGEYQAVFGTRLRTEQLGKKTNGPELVVPITAKDNCKDGSRSGDRSNNNSGSGDRSGANNSSDYLNGPIPSRYRNPPANECYAVAELEFDSPRLGNDGTTYYNKHWYSGSDRAGWEYINNGCFTTTRTLAEAKKGAETDALETCSGLNRYWNPTRSCELVFSVCGPLERGGGVCGQR